MPVLEILPAKKSDAALILQYIKELAEAEKFPFPVSVTRAELEENLFGAEPAAEAVVCYFAGEPCGFAIFYYTFSSTTGKRGLHLDDLYIRPEFQGKGIGKQLLEYLGQLAADRQCARFEWWALNTNDKAIRFYENIGARKLEEISVFRWHVG